MWGVTSVGEGFRRPGSEGIWPAYMCSGNDGSDS